MTQFDFTKKIEDMSEEALKERIKAGYEFEIKHKIMPIPFLGDEEIIEHRAPELIALCPATGYPDTYTLILRYIPDKLIPELKTLRFYLMGYLNLPISHEHLASKIYKEFMSIVKPKKFYLELQTAVRGGIYTNVYRGEKI